MWSDRERIEKVRQLLCEVMPGASASVEPGAGGEHADLLLRWNNAVLLVVVSLVRAPRIAEVEGQLARAILRLQRSKPAEGRAFVVVVVVSRFGAKLKRAVKAFMEECAPQVGWGLIDERDQAVVVIPPLVIEWERLASLPGWEKTPSERRDRQLFTDLNRWMLKVLLLENVPDGFWGGPRRKPRHPTELAEIAHVSVGKAHRFASTFEAEGYLRKTGEALKLVRVPALLEAWLQVEKGGSPMAISVRPLISRRGPAPFEGQRPVEPPLPVAAWGDVALGGFCAATLVGLLRVGGHQLPIVHVAIPLARALHEWRLEKCDPRDAQFILSRPLYPQSVFRGVVERERGAPLVDLWQIALDSVHSAARGQEQAEFVVQRVLEVQEDA